LFYQWLKNGEAVPGATNRTFALGAVEASDDGAYHVVVSNAFGTVTSRAARIHIIPRPSSLTARIFTNGTARLPYRLFTPSGVTDGKRYPLVIFLHGIGERGSDNLLQINANPQGLVFVAYGHQAREAVFFAAPQCPSANTWSDSTMQNRLSAFIEALAAELPIDTNRIYITGLSMGGYGCWSLLDAAPQKFAAAVPICGGGSALRAAALKDLAIWNFHAADDGSVPISESRSMINALRSAGSGCVYTEYTSGGHGIWGQAYATPGLVEWTLAQQRAQPPTNGPSLTIESKDALSAQAVPAGLLRLQGTASFPGETVTQVTWTNLTLRVGGLASGNSTWSVPSIPLGAERTNTVLIIGQVPGLAPGLGGRTTFADLLRIVTGPPFRLHLSCENGFSRLSLANPAGGFVYEYTSDLLSPEWTELAAAPDGSAVLPTVPGPVFFRATIK
jgi:poly(3-hydroxybutyrate) depolymerase